MLINITFPNHGRGYDFVCFNLINGPFAVGGHVTLTTLNQSAMIMQKWKEQVDIGKIAKFQLLTSNM